MPVEIASWELWDYLFLIKCVTRSLKSFLILYYIFMNTILNNFKIQNNTLSP